MRIVPPAESLDLAHLKKSNRACLDLAHLLRLRPHPTDVHPCRLQSRTVRSRSFVESLATLRLKRSAVRAAIRSSLSKVESWRVPPSMANVVSLAWLSTWVLGQDQVHGKLPR